MRSIDNGENASLASLGHLLTACNTARLSKSKLLARVSKLLVGPGKVSTPWVLGPPINFCQTFFLTRAEENRENLGGLGGGEIMYKIRTTNVLVS